VASLFYQKLWKQPIPNTDDFATFPDTMKERSCYASSSYDKDFKLLTDRPIPYGDCTLSTELILVPEILFNSSLVPRNLFKEKRPYNYETVNYSILHTFINLFKQEKVLNNFYDEPPLDYNSNIVLDTYNCIMSCPTQFHDELFKNIVFSGGNIGFNGFSERFFC